MSVSLFHNSLPPTERQAAVQQRGDVVTACREEAGCPLASRETRANSPATARRPGRQARRTIALFTTSPIDVYSPQSVAGHAHHDSQSTAPRPDATGRASLSYAYTLVTCADRAGCRNPRHLTIDDLAEN